MSKQRDLRDHAKALAELADRIREINDPDDLAFAAAEILGRTLSVSRAGYGTINVADETISIERDWNMPGVKSLAGVLHFRDYGSYIEDLKAGRTVVIADAEKDPRTAEGAAALKAISAQSLVNMPVTEQGGFVALLYLNHATAREWSEPELTLIREVAERTRTAVERRRAEAALRLEQAESREAEERYRLAAKATNDAIWDWRLSDGHVIWNEALGDRFGHRLMETTAAWWLDHIHPDDRDRVEHDIHGVIEGASSAWASEYRFRCASGDYAHVFDRGHVLRDDNGKAIRMIGAMLDLTERRRTEDRLRELNATLEQRVTDAVAARLSAEASVRDATEQFRFLVQGVVDYAIYMLDLEGKVKTWNAGAERIKGYAAEHIVGQHFSSFYTEEARTAREPWRLLEEARKKGRIATEGWRLRKDGSKFWASVVIDTVHNDAGDLIGFAKVTRDVTEQREAQRELEAAREALFQAQKMESIGQLTGGLAHDFNNLLGAIGGSFSLIERRLKEGKGGAERYIATGQDAVRRAAALTQRLLAFSRRQTLDPKPVDVNKLIVGMEELIKRTVGPSVAVEVVGQVGLWPTRVDPSQLESALLNLCINGRDAMAPDGGRLTIETANKWLDDRAGRERDLIPGQYVSLCVTDTGCGMDQETISRAFDPFFTTKPIGQGTGLGLSMVYGFVRQSGGQVRIYSELGKGTTMCLYLPRFAGEVEENDNIHAEAKLEPASGETVLVIDDEPTLRMQIVDVLEEAGYKILQAGTGPEGLKLLQSGARIDLLVTDVGLPGGMNGRQVADAARVTRPDLKVLFITGYAENAAIGNGHLEPGMVVVTKPFVITDFAAKVRDLIDS